MKTILLISGLTTLFLFGSCGDTIVKVNCDGVGPPIFSSGPTTENGASTIDFIFSINQTAVVYIVVYNSDQGDLTSDQVKNAAMGSGGSVRLVETLTCNQVSDGDVVLTVSGIQDNTTVYAYIVAESNSQDEILQDAPVKREVDMLEKQPVETFQSTAEGREVLYLVYTPEELIKNSDATEYPAIIFLGGNGEVAAQGEINLIRNNSLPDYLDRGADIPFFVFSPQHINFNWNVDMVNEMVEEAKANYPIDVNRIHMTGISGGGIGTWNYAVNYPEQLASVIPISGDGQDGRACDMANVAVWAFHNDPDGIVSTNGSINMVNAINACTPAPPTAALLTLFEDNGHNAWRRVYDMNHPDWNKTVVEPVDIYEWFSEQSK